MASINRPPKPAYGPITPEQDIVDRLLASVKVIASTECKVHKVEALCSCRAAMATLGPHNISWCKEQYFRQVWEQCLLDNAHAYAYDGTQEAHRTFTAAEGTTPKHYAREYLQGDTIKIVAPAGKLQDTVKIMVEFWTMRAKMWKERYGDWQTAKEKWLEDEWPETCERRKDSDFIPSEWFTEEARAKMKPGTALPLCDFQCGPPWHRNTVTLMAVDCEDAAQNEEVKVSLIKCGVVKIKRCHEDCEVGEQLIKENMPHFTHQMGRLFFGKTGEAMADPELMRIVDPKVPGMLAKAEKEAMGTEILEQVMKEKQSNEGEAE